ncbi:type 1 fimbrial protein, partial [Salmonella enterica]|nr:type 1 fimbrial protein [Salmonella enterica]EBS4389659.1 type 1 fimbrial protein [Salmonella enterica subsp. enterica serovar Panama]EAO8078021.1 type 1 fimbrial protein [Salmonella enterica]EAQ0564795.1 type 1 fimbrial protein [Salmonella enterica]EAQ7747685.1 type 1 fimbrial protein [Salmonella enterica]
MKIKNCLFLLGTAMAVMSSSAFADTMGTQTFTANITANTCTVDNLNKTVDLGTIHLSDLVNHQGSGHYTKGIGVNEIFKVTNCPNALTKVQVVPTFNAGPGDDMVKNTGTASNMYIWFNKTFDGTAPAAANVWHNGKAREFNLTAGGADIPVNGLLLHATNDKNLGTLDFQMTFAFDF